MCMLRWYSKLAYRRKRRVVEVRTTAQRLYMQSAVGGHEEWAILPLSRDEPACLCYPLVVLDRMRETSCDSSKADVGSTDSLAK
jgi:hypothetical protein